jgi:hypothetical protein
MFKIMGVEPAAAVFVNCVDSTKNKNNLGVRNTAYCDFYTAACQPALIIGFGGWPKNFGRP